jgi:hypothetical protein
MTQDQLDLVLKQFSAKLDKEGWWTTAEGTLLGLQIAHDGASLSVGRIDRLRVEAGIVTARTAKRETHCFALADVYALSTDSGAGDKGRRPGFG